MNDWSVLHLQRKDGRVIPENREGDAKLGQDLVGQERDTRAHTHTSAGEASLELQLIKLKATHNSKSSEKVVKLI